MKFIKFVLANLLLLVILLTAYIVHVKFFRVDVVFYSAIFDGLFATIVTLLCVTLIKWLDAYSAFEKLQLVCIWLLFGYAFAISVPTVLDRSLSFYILEKLQQRGGGIRLDGFDQVFTREYVNEHRLVDVRLTEQQQSGTVTIVDGCVKLTDWGQTLATGSRYFRSHFLPKQRLLMGKYSDDLTDPFKNSPETVDYLCK